MKQRVIRNLQELEKASQDLLNLGEFIPFVISITEGAGIRTSKQNASYWVDITHFMIEINNAVERLTEETGMNNLEARRTVAAEMEVEECPTPKASYSLSFIFGKPLIPLYFRLV